MKTLLHPIFIVSVMLASANQLAERSGLVLPVIHSYLDDVLCFPIVLTVGLAAYRIILPQYTLTGWHVWPLFGLYALVFEWYLPQISKAYTADLLDLVAYLVGIFIFLKWINKPTADLASPWQVRSQKE